jgi:hypothetical protein
MKFKENTDVMTSGGEKIGRIDPATGEVTHLVVKKAAVRRE